MQSAAAVASTLFFAGHEAGNSPPLGWGFDPLIWAGVGLAAILYGRGLRRWRRRSHPYSGWHGLAFYAGLAIVLLATQSPLEHLSHELLSAHMGQHLLLTMWAAPLLVLGAPVTPMLRGLPKLVRLGIVRPVAKSRLARRAFPLLVRPLPSLALATAALWAWHLPAAYDLAAENDPVHVVQHLSFTVTAMLFWASLIDAHPLRSKLSYPGRMLYLLAGAAQSSPLAVVIMLAAPGLYSSYQGAWGFTAVQDQQAAGLIMLVPGDMVYLAAIVICALVWLEKQESAELQGAKTPGADAAGPKP